MLRFSGTELENGFKAYSSDTPQSIKHQNKGPNDERHMILLIGQDKVSSYHLLHTSIQVISLISVKWSPLM